MTVAAVAEKVVSVGMVGIGAFYANRFQTNNSLKCQGFLLALGAKQRLLAPVIRHFWTKACGVIDCVRGDQE